MTTLSALLKRHRESIGMTQEELADAAGVSARTISDVERGVRATTYRDTAARLARALRLGGEARTVFEDAARGRPSHRSRSSPVDGHHPTVPRPLTTLFGREADLAVVVAALTDPGVRLVTVTGPGGIGKTRVALEAAHRSSSRFPDGVRFLSMGPDQDPRLIAPAIAAIFGVRPADSVQALAGLLGGGRFLLVIDTFEHIIQAAPQITHLLGLCDGLTVLITSREALHVRGEHQVLLSPLKVPPVAGLRAEQVADWPATGLFIDRARAARPDLVFDDDCIRLVAEVCARLSGLPLAIELAAARVKHLPLTALRDQLGGHLLIGGPRDLPPRQQTMRDTVTWSYRLLGEEEQTVFRGCSVFAGGWTLQAAQIVCSPEEDPIDILAMISALVDKNVAFLDAEAGEPRYGMLDVIREHAAEQRDTQSETDDLQRRHAHYFLQMAVAAAGELQGGQQRTWHRRLEVEHDNLRAALRWAIRHQDAGYALALTAALWQFWRAHSDLTEGRLWLREALSLDPHADPPARAKALLGAAWLALHQRDDTDAQHLADELVTLTEPVNDPLTRRHTLTMRGMIEMAGDRHVEAVPLFQQSLDICRGLGRDWTLATSLLNLGIATMHAGDPRRGQTLIEEAHSLYQQLDDEHFVARCQGFIGYAALLQNDLSRARSHLQTSLTLFADLQEPGGTADSLDSMAAIAAADGQAGSAAYLAGAAHSLRETVEAQSLTLDYASKQRYLTTARHTMTDNAWKTAWEQGRSAPLHQAIARALATSRTATSPHAPQ
jgi:predicted ATPase/transcriptional regulator with XRE-family HTH domain